MNGALPIVRIDILLVFGTEQEPLGRSHASIMIEDQQVLAEHAVRGDLWLLKRYSTVLLDAIHETIEEAEAEQTREFHA